MGRLSCFLTALLLLPAGAASAAFLSTYAVSASVSGSLVSATFGDGLDALGNLNIWVEEDGFDDFPTGAFGNAAADSSIVSDFDGPSVMATASGAAGGPFGSSVATSGGRLIVFFENLSTDPIDILLAYTLDLGASVTGPGASVLGRAEFELQDFFGQVFSDAITTFGDPQSKSGQATLTVAGGATGYAIGWVDALGDATVLAPVPLPAGLPLLASGLVLLAVGRRCRAASV